MANNTLKILFICFIANLFNVRADKASFFQRNFDVLHRDPFPTPAKSRASVQSLWIEQKLDHFDENNKHTWKMRYMANEELFQKGGPVFIYVGGEWDISPGPISSGHLYDMAKEHKGYLFYTEHRYYGDSHPTSDLAVENLKYLNIKQALADLAHFIRTMKATIPGMANSKVILAGGSYAGTMVTWFKKLYPDLAVGCWASSAPLFAELNFYKYKEVAGQSILNIGGQDCYKRIQNGIFELESMVANKRAAEVKAMLKLCNNFDETNDLDVWTLFGEIAGHFAGLAQYHNGGDIQKVCKKVMEGGDDDAIAVAKYIASQLSTKKCTDLSYEESLSNMKKLEWSDSMAFLVQSFLVRLIVKMKITFGLFSICLLAIICNATSEEQESFIVRNFKALHSEPFIGGGAIKGRATVEELWIDQKVDNFDDKNDKTWKMRYLANGEFFQKGGPVFIYVGAEWTISPGSISDGHFYDMAKEHNGYLFYTEHRYYGKSFPTKDLSTENLKYLDIKQALADLAHFIRTMKSTISGMADSKVILAGGSFAGSLVTWFKGLYPDLADGVWASSAPLYAELNFKRYKEVMGESVVKVSGQVCYERIQNGIYELESMFENKRGAEVKAMLKLCNNFDEYNDLDVGNLFYEISELFANLVQTHSDGNIQKACAKIMQGDDDAISIANYIRDQLNQEQCAEFTYKSALENSMYTSTSNPNMMRQWWYQSCNEFGWFQTSSSRKQPFGSKYPLIYFSATCADLFGSHLSEEYMSLRAKETNDVFGALIPDIENVYWSNGNLDPWHALSKTEGEMTKVIPMYAHCKDFGSIDESDSDEMRDSKERIAELIRQWVKA